MDARQILDQCPVDTRQILDRCPGLSYRQFDNWIRLGWLHPEPRTGGSGVIRTFTNDEARVARAMATMVKAGLTPAAAHKVARGYPDLAPGVRVECWLPGEQVSR